MRGAVIGLLVSTGCAQVLGLDTPALGATKDAGELADGIGPGMDANDGALARCRGDNFDDNSLDQTKWIPFAEGISEVNETGQRLQLVIENSVTEAYCGVDAVAPLAAHETGVQLQIVTPSPDNESELAVALRVNASNAVYFGKDETYLAATVRTNGATMVQTAAWVTDQHRFLRITRGPQTAVTFSTSNDGVAWNTFWTTQVVFAQQTLTPEIYAGHYAQVNTAITAVDDFVVLAPDCAP